MNPFLESALKVSVVVALTLAIAATLKRRPAALRHWLLAVGLSSAALMPVVGVVLPVWHAPISLSAPSPRVGTLSSSSAVPVVAPDPSAADMVVVATPAVPSGGRRISATQILGTMWMAGVGLSLTVLLIGLARLSWLASRARPIVDGPWAVVANEVSRMYGLRRPVLVLQSDHPSLLVAWGLARPAVILPEAAREWSEDRARIVLSHELAHIGRSDWLAQIVAELLRAVYWFNPLVWMACRRLRDESERACDDAVLGGGVDGSDYAAELLELARTLNSRRERWISAPAMARASSLEGRVAAMLNAQINRRPMSKSVRLTTAAALVAVALAIAAFSASAQTFSSLSGSVVDQLGGAISGVTLSLTNRDTGQKYEVHSSSVGSYEFVGLTSGEYNLETGMPGFRSAKGSVTVTGKNLRQDVQLKVGSLEETITVVGSNEPRPDAPAVPRVRSAKVSPKPECVVQPTGGVLAQPRKIVDVRPISPDKSGLVVLDALIGTDGTVTDARPVDLNVDPSLAAAAVEAVKQWQYTPTLLNCVAIEVPMKVTVNFKVE
jgi:beta-lactamase regulating signal transducer with metallopeptidase domain